MRIILDNPPNINEIQKELNIGDAKMIYCYGEVIYNPHKLDISDHLKIHELVHSRQQVIPEAWWDRYLNDPEFRLSQELEAYREQYRFAKKWIKDRNLLARFLWAIASDLANLYKVNITHSEAMERIKR